MGDLLQKILGRVIRRKVLRPGLGMLCAFVVMGGNSVLAAEDAGYKVTSGLAIYLGVSLQRSRKDTRPDILKG